MLKFEGKIVQFGFGAVGKSFFEKLPNEISVNLNNYYVISRDKYEFEAYVNLGGIISNFINVEIKRDNFEEVFSKYLSEGDLLIDFAESVGTKDILKWCALNNIMYINTGETDWPDNWYNIFDENEYKWDIRNELTNNANVNKYPIVIHHGNNPGLVSHFVKAAIEYIAKKQFRKDKYLKQLIDENRFNEAASYLKIKTIHVNDIDTQKVRDEYKDETLYSTWCIDSYFFEMLSEATFDVGTHEEITYLDDCKNYNEEKGYFEFKTLAAEKACKTIYPEGEFEGYMVPHEETISIAKNLELKENGKVIYRPTVVFLYSPCEYARKYIKTSKVNNYPNSDPDKMQDGENNGTTIIRGHIYPPKAEIIYKEKISEGTEYVGVLLLGEKFNPVWVGNRIKTEFLYKKSKGSFWQTPTITPVSMSALSAVCWMIENKDKGGIYFPDEIEDYNKIIKKAEKYISKTIYKTFDKAKVEETLNCKLDNIQIKDLFV